MTARAPEIDAGRLWRSIEELARVGATGSGGVSRIALTREDAAGRELLTRWAAAAGCECRIDAAGNLFLRRPGTRPGLSVAFGSHLDTQPDGGAFDGALGVLAGLELMRALADADVATAAPLELVVWTDEEGARFDVSCIGSSVFAGALALADAHALRDGDGVPFADALANAAVAAAEPTTAVELAGYFELHIEQGPRLEEAGLRIGIVEGIVGIRWLEATFEGTQGHAGTTPMDRRADALQAAARVVTAVAEIGSAHGTDGRGTVCVLEVEPNAGSVIPGRVRMLIDLRHPSADVLDAMQRDVERALAGGADAVSVSLRERWVQPPIAFDAECVELVAAAAGELPAARMLSGAGHDAGYVAAVAPTAMIFVPCRGGVSHHPDEYAAPEDVAAGARVLLRAVCARAGLVV